LYLIFLIVVGFGYSFFWCASTIIYLLMRRRVDDTDLDEIHLEEDEFEEPYTTQAATVTAPARPTAPAPAGGGGAFIPTTDIGVRQPAAPPAPAPTEPVKPRAAVTQLAPPESNLTPPAPAPGDQSAGSSLAPAEGASSSGTESAPEHKDGNQTPPGGAG